MFYLSYSFVSGKLLIKKWKTIRDTFVKNHRLVLKKTGKPVKKRKQNNYYDQLQFLVPHIRNNVNISSNIKFITSNKSNAEESNVTQDPLAIDDPRQSQVANETIISTRISPTIIGDENPSNRKCINNQSRISKKGAVERSVALTAEKLTDSVLSESLALQKEEQQQVDVYGHKAFLMSFVPILNSLPLHKAMQARLQISQVISELADNIHSTANAFQKLDTCLVYTSNEPNGIF